ncbi:hypothetical protein D3C79_1062760 [compost metagenome]
MRGVSVLPRSTETDSATAFQPCSDKVVFALETVSGVIQSAIVTAGIVAISVIVPRSPRTVTRKRGMADGAKDGAMLA